MGTKKINDLFKGELKVINIGLESFAENLKKEGIEVIHVNWSPPAGGDEEMNDLLDLLND